MKVLDLFSGAGGTAWGFLQAGFEIAGAVDIDDAAIRTYLQNIHVQPMKMDLLTVEATELQQRFNLQEGELDVLVGCPPCQGFTRMVGDRGADDPRNNLVLRYLEIVKVLKPKCIVFENVPGINKKHGEILFQQFCLELKNLGYGFDFENPGRVLNAADYGVPQLRERVVLIAGRDGQIPPYPVPTHGAPDSDGVLNGQLQRWVSVEEALQEYPAIEAGQTHDLIPNHRARAMGERVKNFISLITEPGGSRTDVPQEFWLECHKKTGCGHLDVYGRLPLDRPAGVMTSGCTNVSKGRFVHPTQNRGISFREAARLQSFPNEFIFEGNMDEISTQIGNAVPPVLARAIAEGLVEWLRATYG